MSTQTGIDLSYHLLTANQMARSAQDLLDARPLAPFDKLKVGKVYYRKPAHSGGGDDTFRVVKVLPSGKQVVVARRERGEGLEGHFVQVDRLYAGSYYNTKFVELDETLIALLGVTHQAVVTEAVRQGLEIPPLVRREYPALFLDVPKRFDKDRGEGYRDDYRIHKGTDRVAEALNADWGESWPKKPVNVDAVDAWIERVHRDVMQFRDLSIRRIAMNRDLGQDYERQWRDFEELVDFYRWLRPHVAPGGIFYVEEKLE